MSGGGSKDKYANISSSSFLSLKAELSEKKDALSKTRGRDNDAYSAVIKGKSPFASKKRKRDGQERSNKGVLLRAARDQVVYEQDVEHDPDAYKKALERKARIYEQIRRGTDDLTDAQKEQLLVDWDGKQLQGHAGNDSSSEDESEDNDQGPAVESEVEFTDEFGRTRKVPRSQLPKGYSTALPTSTTEQMTDNVIYGDQTSFPVYTPSDEYLAKHKADALAPLETRYDASKEYRTRGAGFYSFDQDEDKRREQMRDLEARRAETLKERARERETRQKVVADRRELVERKRRELDQKRSARQSQPV